MPAIPLHGLPFPDGLLGVGVGPGTVDVWDREIERTQAVLDKLAPWPQNVTLPNGLETAPERGETDSKRAADVLAVLPRVAGSSILVMGSWCGAVCFALAEGGADVLGLEPEPRHVEQARWLRNRMGGQNRVRFRQAPLYALSRMPTDYDTVLLLDGFRRVRYPDLILDLALERAKEHVIIGSDTDGVPGWTGDFEHLQRRLRDAGADVLRTRRNLIVCHVKPRRPGAELLAATGRPFQDRAR